MLTLKAFQQNMSREYPQEFCLPTSALDLAEMIFVCKKSLCKIIKESEKYGFAKLQDLSKRMWNR